MKASKGKALKKVLSGRGVLFLLHGQDPTRPEHTAACQIRCLRAETFSRGEAAFRLRKSIQSGEGDTLNRPFVSEFFRAFGCQRSRR